MDRFARARGIAHYAASGYLCGSRRQVSNAKKRCATYNRVPVAQMDRAAVSKNRGRVQVTPGALSTGSFTRNCHDQSP